MPSIPVSELAKIKYLDATNLHGRNLASLTFHAEGEWHFWLPIGDSLVRLQGQPKEGFYFAEAAESDQDAYLDFLNFIAQRGNWPKVSKPLKGLMEDFFNLGASLRKFEVLVEHSKLDRHGTSRLVLTEVEYLFSLCRSIFDLLQEVIAAQWTHVRFLDSSTRKRQLPSSFSDVLLASNQLRSAPELTARFLIPLPLAEFYLRTGPFFQLLRQYRDKYVHGGNSPELVFVTERGFALRGETEPFSKFGVWNAEHRLPNDLCSLRPALAYLVLETLKACEDYAFTIQRIIQFPPPLCPGFHFFMRSDFTKQLRSIEEVVDRCAWWGGA